MSNLDLLSQVMEEEKAKEILKLTQNYDNYIKKFKERMNTLLAPVNYEVKLGIVFSEKEKEE